ncbi:MAG TPA: Ig domain-containing protein [Bryobacteraceae bacterium]|nr:Ig domain-containing protein [Bryobacteraceae bacterium]
MNKLLFVLSILGLAGSVPAAQVTYQFTGTTSSAMSVNNGTSTGSVPAGTPYSGTLTFDDAQTATPAAFFGGAHSTYAFSGMTLTIGTTTVTWGPGTLDVYDNLASTAGGYPVGDSFYANISAPVAPNGTINGAQFNWIALGLVDNTGTAFTGSSLPANLNMASFQSAFIEFNYGTQGTPWGAGNTSTLQFLTTLSKASGSPTPPPTITTTALPAGVIGVPYSAPITASAPNGDALTIAVAGLPAGLSFDGANITGVPAAVGTSNVVITATDQVTNLSTTSTLPLAVKDAAISFAPTLPNGVVNYPYSATFAPATGGTGSFTYTAAGLPAGLTLTGNTVAGTPTAAGTSTVTLTATDTAGFSASASVTLTITSPVPVPCSGKNAVESAYVPRNPGYIVVNGGLNLLDHLWTTYLNSSNTTFLGGLVNWYQTGLILDYTGTVDPNGCVLSSLTVRPAVTIETTSLAAATAGMPYASPIVVSWGVAPYTITVAGLPAGLAFNGSQITGTPLVAGSFSVTVSAVDSVHATAVQVLALTVNPSPYTVRDEGQGKITAVGADYLMVGKKKLIWNANTRITVNTPSGEIHVINSFVRVGMKVQWKGLADKTTNTVMTSQLEIN